MIIDLYKKNLHIMTDNVKTNNIFIPPPQNVGGGLYWIRFVLSVGPSISNSCPLYNSFTNGRISFKLEWHIHLN